MKQDRLVSGQDPEKQSPDLRREFSKRLQSETLFVGEFGPVCTTWTMDAAAKKIRFGDRIFDLGAKAAIISQRCLIGVHNSAPRCTSILYRLEFDESHHDHDKDDDEDADDDGDDDDDDDDDDDEDKMKICYIPGTPAICEAVKSNSTWDRLVRNPH